MNLIISYLESSVTQIWESKNIFIIAVIAFSISIFSYFYKEDFNQELKSKLKYSGSFENFRVFDHAPSDDFYWDELHKFLGVP